MPKNLRFWRNLTLIGLAHVVVIIGLVRWSRESEKTNAQSIVWMNGGAGDGAATVKPKAAFTPKPARAAMPAPEPKSIHKEPPRDEEQPLQPFLASAKSEIQLPTATPRSTSTASPARTLKAIPVTKGTPKPKPTPKPTSRPTPKKTLLAKASPKPSPRIIPTPAKSDESNEADTEAVKKEIPKATLTKTETEKTDSSEKPPKAIAANAGTGKGTSTGAGGHAGGAGGESPFGWYGSMLHDRFYSEWSQPTTAVPSNVKLAVLVKLRIENDGRVSKFEIIKPSNNVIVDESVAAVAKRVTKVDPLPAGLVKGDHYDVRINFELNSD